MIYAEIFQRLLGLIRLTTNWQDTRITHQLSDITIIVLLASRVLTCLWSIGCKPFSCAAASYKRIKLKNTLRGTFLTYIMSY